MSSLVLTSPTGLIALLVPPAAPPVFQGEACAAVLGHLPPDPRGKETAALPAVSPVPAAERLRWSCALAWGLCGSRAGPGGTVLLLPTQGVSGPRWHESVHVAWAGAGSPCSGERMSLSVGPKGP